MNVPETNSTPYVLPIILGFEVLTPSDLSPIVKTFPSLYIPAPSFPCIIPPVTVVVEVIYIYIPFVFPVIDVSETVPLTFTVPESTLYIPYVFPLITPFVIVVIPSLQLIIPALVKDVIVPPFITKFVLLSIACLVAVILPPDTSISAVS